MLSSSIMKPKETFVRTDKETLTKLRALAGDRSISQLLRDVAAGGVIPSGIKIESKLADLDMHISSLYSLVSRQHDEFKILLAALSKCLPGFTAAYDTEERNPLNYGLPETDLSPDEIAKLEACRGEDGQFDFSKLNDPLNSPKPPWMP